jgi:hypothetical protein
MYRCALPCLLALLLAACSGTFEGQRGAVANPLRHVREAPDMWHRLPVLRAHPAPLGPAMDAYPVYEPAVVKRVWIVAHDNRHGDRISGHYVDILYQPPRFAPLPRGVARLPVAPRLKPITPQVHESAPAAPPLQRESSAALSHEPVAPVAVAPAPAPPPPHSIRAPGSGISPELMERLQRIRHRLLDKVPPPPPVAPGQGETP